MRLQGTWETWLEFFLESIMCSAQQATNMIYQINVLFEQDFIKLATLGRARFSCELILEYMKQLPQVTVSSLTNQLSITAPTARSAIQHLVKMGILTEISGKRRTKIYVYRQYLDYLEEGAKPF